MSLIGKVLAATAPAGPPVPMGETGIWRMPSAAKGRGGGDEAFLRAYAANGTTFSNGSLLASATAGPEWKLFRSQPPDGRRRYSTSDQGSDQRKEVTAHPALNLLTRPNPHWSRFRLFELSQLYQDLTGKTHWVLTKIGGMPVGIWPVRPDRMQPVPDKDKYLLGWLYTAPGGSETVALDPDEVIYNPLPDPLDSYGGTGPIQSVLTEIDAVGAAAQYNRNFFRNSARPDGVLSVDHRVSDDEWEELTDRWRDAHRGVARAHRVAVLEGVTWVPTSTVPKDMDFPNLMSTGGDRIREALGMHKIMTGLVDDVNRANAQTGEEIFAAWKVAPRLRRWKDVLNFQYLPLFGADGKGVEFDFIYPMPVNREQDNLELTAKANAALSLVTAGYDQADVLRCVGLPDMKPVLHITDVPALPPRWTTPMSAPPGGGAPAPEEAQAAQDAAVAELRARGLGFCRVGPAGGNAEQRRLEFAGRCPVTAAAWAQLAGELSAAAQPDYSGSCMIALYPPPVVAGQLAVPGGLAPADIHLTVAYTGDCADVDQFTLASAAQALASRAPVAATISGHARFTGGDDGDVIVALADSPDLDALRRDVENELAVRGIAIPSEHGFTAHLTICYLDPDAPDPVGRLAAFPVTFAAVTAEYGTERYTFPFTGTPAAPAVPGAGAWLALTEAIR